jgi:hypothetical protein
MNETDQQRGTWTMSDCTPIDWEHCPLREVLKKERELLDRDLASLKESVVLFQHERGSFITIREHEKIESKIDDLKTFQDNMQGRIWMVGAGLFILQIMMTIVSFWILHSGKIP